MQFRVLGTVAAVTDHGDPLPLGPAKRHSLLAVLLLHPGTAVTVDRLTGALWEEEPPRHSRTVLQGHVSRLRALFTEYGAAAQGIELVTQGPAYVLRLPGAVVDAHRFEELLAPPGAARAGRSGVGAAGRARAVAGARAGRDRAQPAAGERRARAGGAAAGRRGRAGGGARAARRARRGGGRPAGRGRREPAAGAVDRGADAGAGQGGAAVGRARLVPPHAAAARRSARSRPRSGAHRCVHRSVTGRRGGGVRSIGARGGGRGGGRRCAAGGRTRRGGDPGSAGRPGPGPRGGAAAAAPPARFHGARAGTRGARPGHGGRPRPDRHDHGQRRGREDGVVPALGAPAPRGLPRRPALRRPARLQPRPGPRHRRRAPRVPARARGPGRGDARHSGVPGRPLPRADRPPPDAGGPGQRP